jgi:hypothetical protein
MPSPPSTAPTFGFPLGEPPLDDVEAAAQLFMRYVREAPLDSDRAAMFLQMCLRPSAVAARISELRTQAAE